MILFNSLMKLITKKLSYCNTDEWIEKLFAILWKIPDNKWTEYKFELENVIDKISGPSLTIQSENVIDCLRFFMGYLGFWKN